MDSFSHDFKKKLTDQDRQQTLEVLELMGFTPQQGELACNRLNVEYEKIADVLVVAFEKAASLATQEASLATQEADPEAFIIAGLTSTLLAGTVYEMLSDMLPLLQMQMVVLRLRAKMVNANKSPQHGV